MKCKSVLLRITFAAQLLFAINASPIIGQTTSTSGSIVGVVTESSGGTIAGAKVTLKSEVGEVTAVTNASGQYSFPVVAPGTYTLSVMAEGFQAEVVAGVVVQVAKSTLIDIILKVGAVTQSVKVEATAQTQLQTTDAAVSNVMNENEVQNLPTVTRRAVELAWLQPGAQPWTGGSFNGASGTVAGVTGDQNTFTLDGLDISDVQVGGECCGNYGAGLPLPVEAVEEFNSSVTNQNANFGRSAGGDFSFAVRHGGPQYHGAAYWYHVDDHLVANTFFRDALNQPKPKFLDNRAGFRLGGPLFGPVVPALKDKLFFFLNLERRRFPNSSQVFGLMPSATLRQGILRFPDASGNIVSYNLATSTLCGPAGNLQCDPRGIGISPVIAQQYALLPNGNAAGGDGLNTIGLNGPASSAQNTDNAVGRIDYNFSKKWRANGIWSWAENAFLNPFNSPGIDWRGGPSHLVTTALIANHPHLYGFGLTGEIAPTVVNEFHLGYNQSTLQFVNPNPQTLISAAGAPLHLPAVEDPVQIFSSRAQLGISRTWQFSDNVTKVSGKHQIQFGANYSHLYYSEVRQGGNNFNVDPIASIGTNVNVPTSNSEEPPTCGGGVTTNCLRGSDVNSWNLLYAQTLGIVDSVDNIVVRTPQGVAEPAGSPLSSAGTWHHFEYHVSDIWRLTNSLTLSLGLTGDVETPFDDNHGRQSFIINQQTGQPIDPVQYLNQRAAAARDGQIFNPGFGWAPISNFKGRGYFPVQNHIGPRLAAAWNPSFKEGLFGRIFGDRKSVFRGGYGLSYYRALAIGEVNFAEEGDQLLAQTNSLTAPVNGQGQPFRVGVDGPVPVPAPAQQIPVPYIPPSNKGAGFILAFSPNYKVAHIHSFNFTYQREIPGNMIVEVGYLGRLSRNLETNLDLNAVPFFITDLSKKSSQTFAQAFDLVATQLRQGVNPANVTPQPFFENSLAPGATVFLTTNDASDFITENTDLLWQFHIDPILQSFGKQPLENQQLTGTDDIAPVGWSNYHAMFLSVNKRTSKGLTFTFNYTLSKWNTTLEDTTDSGSTLPINDFNLHYGYGPAFGDRRHVISAYGIYDLPFGRGHRFTGGPLRRVVDDWHLANVITYASGLPVFINSSGEPFGAFSGNESVPAVGAVHADTGVHTMPDGSLNLFANPAAVLSQFRPFLISQDTGNSAGAIRGLGRFTWDMSLSKGIAVTERLKVKLGFDFFNVLNHPLFRDPFPDILSPNNFGTITSQPGDPTQGDYWTPRRIQASLRIEF